MEINKEILSALALINSDHINHEDLVQIFEQCNQTLIATNNIKETIVNLTGN